ncbi:AMP-binding protein [Pseudomonas panipatensis]|uniref:Fatty-acyl-CoA synthase n=1 Tax=Pseudomonas panipatensis TaxID=428992 RepID=A0A1G8HF39_9PSED|nr:AMP-binding protein [Pseudomonas panipatensis]SDI05131.1 fatty-acyl-CoA synthase [Pseudomonas panipatensis]SMP57854.1 fatty-acyl-CoA synthase [Pseudomonas panipatensis]
MTTAASTPNHSMLSRLESAPSPFDQLTRSAQARPDHTAIEYLASETDTTPFRLSYAELLQDVRALASALLAAGVKENDSVAILLPLVPQAVTALIAATAVGRAFPVNLLLSAEAIHAQLKLARSKVVVSMGPHPAFDVHARLAQALSDLPEVTSVIEVPVAEVSAGAMSWATFLGDAEAFKPVDAADSIATLIHTGGTTGMPRLACLSRRNIAAGALMAASSLGIRASDRLLTGLPLFHVGGAIDAVLAALSTGASIVFPTLLGMRNRAITEHIWPLIDRHRISLLSCVPTTLAGIADSPLLGANLDRLRAVLTGGSPLPRELASRIEQKISKPVCQLYGMTESSGIASAQSSDGPCGQHSVGKPAPLVRLSLNRPGGDIEHGVRGEVLISGPNVFQGYLSETGIVGRPEDGWLHTGDLGEFSAEGELRIVGRSKEIIIRSGHNIDPQLIEDSALAHPAILQAAAVGMPDEYAGEVPVLFIVLRTGEAASEDDLSTYIRTRIAEPPAQPKRLFLLAELPLTPFAKVARFRLRQIAVEHRVRDGVDEIVKGAVVTCNDPAAKRVAICAPGPVSDAQRQAIERLLASLGLEAEP